MRLTWIRHARNLMTYVPWDCEYCHKPNETPKVLWHDIKYRLICRWCRYMQNYPDHIIHVDPEPPTISRV